MKRDNSGIILLAAIGLFFGVVALLAVPHDYADHDTPEATMVPFEDRPPIGGQRGWGLASPLDAIPVVIVLLILYGAGTYASRPRR